MSQWWIVPNHSPLPLEDNIPEALLVGYAVFTTFRWPLCFQSFLPHWERLSADAGFIGLRGMSDPKWLYEALHKLPNTDTGTFALRLTAVADAPDLSPLFTSESLPLKLLASRRPAPSFHEPLERVGCWTYDRPLPGIKHGQYLPEFLARREMSAQGVSEMLRFNGHGHLSEACMANVFAIGDGVILTPDPRRDGCLPGITRRRVLEILPQTGFQTSIDPIRLTDLRRFEGVFLTNAVRGLQAVEHIRLPDGEEYSLPWPARSCKLLKALQESLSD